MQNNFGRSGAVLAFVLCAVFALSACSTAGFIAFILVGEAIFDNPPGPKQAAAAVDMDWGWHYVGDFDAKDHLLPQGRLYVADHLIRPGDSEEERVAWLSVDLNEPTKDGGQSVSTFLRTNCKTGAFVVTLIETTDKQKGQGVVKSNQPSLPRLKSQSLARSAKRAIASVTIRCSHKLTPDVPPVA